MVHYRQMTIMSLSALVCECGLILGLVASWAKLIRIAGHERLIKIYRNNWNDRKESGQVDGFTSAVATLCSVAVLGAFADQHWQLALGNCFSQLISALPSS